MKGSVTVLSSSSDIKRLSQGTYRPAKPSFRKKTVFTHGKELTLIQCIPYQNLDINTAMFNYSTVKPVLSGHSKNTKNWISRPIIAE